MSHTHTNILTVFSCQGYGFGLEEKHEIEINEVYRLAQVIWWRNEEAWAQKF